jgi:hypothetical protein
MTYLYYNEGHFFLRQWENAMFRLDKKGDLC